MALPGQHPFLEPFRDKLVDHLGLNLRRDELVTELLGHLLNDNVVGLGSDVLNSPGKLL